jgi:hypothetical protein
MGGGSDSFLQIIKILSHPQDLEDGTFSKRAKMSVKSSSCAAFVLLSLFLTGCATLNPDDVLKAARVDGARGHFIEGVPFFPQTELMCGPAALASVLNYYGDSVGLDEVSTAVYHPELKGSLSMDLLIYAKERGFEAMFYKGGLEDLKQRLGEGRPLILFLNLAYDFYPVGHYVVAVGYNEEMEVVVAHSGTSGAKVLSFGKLLDDWEKTGFSTLLVTPKKG